MVLLSIPFSGFQVLPKEPEKERTFSPKRVRNKSEPSRPFTPTDYYPLTQQELPCFDGVSDDPDTNAMIRQNQEEYVEKMVKKFRNCNGEAVCPPPSPSR